MPKDLVVKKQETALTQIEQVPDFLRGEVGNRVGMEDVDESDTLMPRLGLCQALSPQKKKMDPRYLPGLEEGMLFNTVTGEIYGESVTIVALFFFKNRIKNIPMDQGGGIDCMSPNALTEGRLRPEGCQFCDFSKWGNGKKTGEDGDQDAPECTLYHNLLAFVYEDRSPLAISFKSTGLKVSKQFNANVRLTNLPMYAKKYKLSVTTMRSGQNEWFEKKFEPAGFVTEEEFAQMEKLFKMYREANIKIDQADETDFPTGPVVEGETAF